MHKDINFCMKSNSNKACVMLMSNFNQSTIHLNCSEIYKDESVINQMNYILIFSIIILSCVIHFLQPLSIVYFQTL